MEFDGGCEGAAILKKKWLWEGKKGEDGVLQRFSMWNSHRNYSHSSHYRKVLVGLTLTFPGGSYYHGPTTFAYGKSIPA